MYGGSGKLGRGKRNINAPPINRGGGAAAVTRSRDGGGQAASGPTSSRQAEEKFSLVTRNPLNFAMALRLVPDLVEEINRVEAMGGAARIKFDYNANNANGNVINVGDKNFNFTWSKEMGELCDIYEERKNGEDGNGLLIESGGTWRKLNVQRVLDESTKKHVKMRSEEAERKNKSRKSIVLDHQNSSMKNQMKALAAAESNSWRTGFKRKEPPFKKSKPEPYPAGGPPKSVYKSGLSAQNPSKNRPSSGSSLSSHTEQYGAPAYPSGSSNPVKGYAILSDATPSQASSKATSLDKMSSRMANNTVLNKPIQNQNVDAKLFDLRSFIVSLLMEHHAEGMSLKALEKAIGEAMPNSVQKIQPILKQIATFKAPGRYYLKPGVTENFKKTSSESASSPEVVCNQSPATNNFGRLPDQDPNNFSVRTPINELEEQAHLDSMCGNASDMEEKIEIPLNSPDHSNGKKVSDDSQGRAGSSSDDGSDSDSESNSSDSGSDSESNSREKRSPVGSHSGSSSDSESDVSSSSKQAPDEDVDIMTSDDGKEPKPEPFSKSPARSRPLDIEPLDIGHYEKQDDWVSDIVEIENDNSEDDLETIRPTCSYLFCNEEGEDMKPSPPNHYKYDENQGCDSVVKDGFKHEEPDSYTRSSKGKSKRQSSERRSADRPYSSKRLKDTNLSQPFSGTMTSLFGESPQNSSPDKLPKSPLEASTNQMSIGDANHSNCDPNLQVGFNQGIQYGSFSESWVPCQRSSDAVVGQTEVHSNGKRPGKQNGLGCGVEESERGLQSSGRFWMQNPINMETLHEDGDIGDKQTVLAESISRKPKIMVKATDAGRHSNTQTGYSPKDSNTNTMDRSLVTNGRENKLQRELSELELGEFRKPLPEEIPSPKKQFEKKGKHKQLEKKSADSDYWNSDSNRGKPSKKITPGSRKLSPQNSETLVSGIPDGSSKRKPPENNVNDPSKPQFRETRHLAQQHQSSACRNEFVSNHNKIPEIGKGRNAEPETQRTNSEANGYKKTSVNATDQQLGLKRTVVSQSMNEFKKQESNMIGSSNDRQKDTFLGGGNNGIQKRRESLDEKSFSYAKYEKVEPELKSPIKDLSQYKEYVKEYQEKYDSYCSLNNILESYRDEFSKLGNELETCRGRDNKRYQNILEEIRSSFRQCGEKHKQFKKIFIVLHEELRHLKQRIKDFAALYSRD